MRYRRTIFVILMLIFGTAVRSRAQIFPELNFPLSAEANAMGGAGASVVSNNALATNANPAELGLFSLKGIVSAGVVLGIHSFPDYPFYSNGSLNALGLNLGSRVNGYLLEIPFKASLGIGYSNINYAFEPMPFSGPSVNSRQTDLSNNLTVGLGLEYFVRLGLGYTVNLISSEDAISPPEMSHAVAHGFGAILQIPVIHLISRSTNRPILSVDGIEPMLDVTLAYSQRNIGNYYYFGNPVLPRQGSLGWNFMLGFRTRLDDLSWRLISFTWVRQSDVSLVSEHQYISGLGTFSMYNDMVGGTASGNEYLRKGWQLQVAQFLFLRGGSVTYPSLPTYKTFGWGAKADGLVKLLFFAHWLNRREPLTAFLLQHLDLEFDYSTATGGTFQGEPFETLNLVVR